MMAPPEIAVLKKGEADGGYVRRLRGYFSSDAKVAGQPVGSLRLSAFLDLIIACTFTTSSTFSMFSIWRHFYSDFKMPRTEEFLTEGLISAFLVEPSTPKESLFSTVGPGLYWALGIHLVVFSFYFRRHRVSNGLLQALDPDVSSSLRVKLCKSWLFWTKVLVGVHLLALILNKGIPWLESLRLLMHIGRLLADFFYFDRFCSFIQDQQKKGKSAKFPKKITENLSVQ